MMLLTLMLAESGERLPGKAAQEFGAMDPSGMAMVLIAMIVVFSALIVLYLIFKNITRFNNLIARKRFRKSRPDLEHDDDPGHIPGETLAAISLALHLYHEQLLGLENAVITFKNAAKTYSPWSSKIYGLRRTPKN